MADSQDVPGAPSARLLRDRQQTLVIALAGRWKLQERAPPVRRVYRELDERPPPRVAFDAGELESWDSRLVAFAAEVCERARARGIPVDTGGLPGGTRRLLDLSAGAALQPPPPAPRLSPLARIGASAAARGHRAVDVLAFTGDAAGSLGRLVTGRSRLRRRDLWQHMRASGAQALFIVALVSFLVGLVLAFIGAVQLQAFGATIYVADLVGVAMVREMGAVMTAIVLAGRTGAAFAAELGTMRVTEEIDALSTLGISTYDFLVMPRVLALTVMLPILCVFADVVGVLGGAAIGIGVMDISPSVYYEQTVSVVTTGDFFGGLIKATVYGALVACAGCFEGMRCARSAAGVGRATTAAVVDGIVLVIVASGAFAVAFYLLEI